MNNDGEKRYHFHPVRCHSAWGENWKGIPSLGKDWEGRKYFPCFLVGTLMV